MKKVFTLVAVIALAASFTACKKERTCTCGDLKTTIKSKKSVAKATCEGEGYEVVKVEWDGEDITDDYEEGDNDCTLD